MKAYRIVSASPNRYPVIGVRFDDGLSGEFDMRSHIADDTIFAPLKDPTFFNSLSIAPGGRAMGWNLDDAGREIDLGADNVRIEIETQIVHELAEQYRSHRTAAE